jgi:hypothetical protein
LLVIMYGPPPDCKRKPEEEQAVCVNVSGLCLEIFSPALMMIRRVPVLDKGIGFGQPYTSPGYPARRSTVVSSLVVLSRPR